LAISINEDWATAALVYSINAGYKSGRLKPVSNANVPSNADRIGLAINTEVADIDIVIIAAEAYTVGARTKP